MEEQDTASRVTPSKAEGDLNELLNLNPSIYDLTVQYSCLAVHPYGGKAGMCSLITVLILEILNVCVQMSILLEVDKKIAVPAKAHAENLYELFTSTCYGASDGPLVYSVEVEENFKQWDDHTEKHELCQFPLTAPYFILHFLQDAIPDYRWDLTEVCRSYNEKQLFVRYPAVST